MSTATHDPNKFQIFADGEKFYLVMDQQVYEIESPFLNRINQSVNNNYVESHTMGDAKPMILPGNRIVNLSLDIVGSDIKVHSGIDLFDMKMLKDATILELFDEISRKIKLRH